MSELNTRINSMANNIASRVRIKARKYRFINFNDYLENKVMAMAVKNLKESEELHAEILNGKKREANKKSTALVKLFTESIYKIAAGGARTWKIVT